MRELLVLLIPLAAIALAIWYERTRKQPKKIGRMVSLESNRFGSIEEIEGADWEKYNTCRGRMSKSTHLKTLDILGKRQTATEDEYDYAVDDRLWDWYFHQYTLYSITPIVLDHVLRNIDAGAYVPTEDLIQFVAECASGGTVSIYLTAEELEMNRDGKLPIFKIEDVLAYYSCVENILTEAVKTNEGRG